ncbi:serine/threonine-protein kinase Nek5-like isoform X1 [Magnolia sinica]|uniref:serine/threonine-protein kinase Nek5-like isoform X1 n=1 Tax=Magnolia sinica TaxID=86752 RepID=UPI0026599820|nr:serine/threonine-protein kinase Nek5-like isoform X1 [Magnolia sinica]XP_058102377.1 serine/threonine-protein kinase Nek5-like isoform X1 [Magnolia sinica]XP_058102378.1 serine/threonine-protein kinase Nek5-like isoform X1 [Magnolia sinica]
MDKYEVVEEIGESRLMLVRHETDKKKYVLKRIRLGGRTEKCKLSAYREMALIARIQNPFLVEYKEVWIGKGCYLCIVMDYCEGGDMADIIKKAKGSLFPESKLCKWFVQLLLAVDCLHSNHVLHGNLKCSNIVLTKDLEVRLGDYGFAKLLNDADSSSNVLGTPNSMCPELLADIPYSFKSDIWSLGCCMFEITAHQPAFRSSDMPGLISKIRRSSISALPSVYSPSMKSLIKSMLRKNPDQRPTAAELLKHPHLQKYIAECISPPSFISCPSPMRKTISAHRQRDTLTINPYSNSLSSDRESSLCSVLSRELHSTDVIECANHALHPQPINSSGDKNIPTAPNHVESDTWKDQENNTPISSASTNSAKGTLLESLPRSNNTYQFPQLPPSVSDESKLTRCRDASTNMEVSYKCDHVVSTSTNYQERAEALESLLELCALLLQQRKLNELAGVLKPFGKDGASPRETAIWLTKSMKVVGEEQCSNRDGLLKQ